MLPLPISFLTYDKHIWSARLSPDGHLLAVVTEKHVNVYSIPDMHKIDQIDHGSAVDEIAFNPDSSLLVTASRDHIVRIWNTFSKKITQIEHNDMVLTVAFSPDGCYLVTTVIDYTAKLWDISDLRALTKIT
jgi:WD40 repeat protein